MNLRLLALLNNRKFMNYHFPPPQTMSANDMEIKVMEFISKVEGQQFKHSNYATINYKFKVYHASFDLQWNCMKCEGKNYYSYLKQRVADHTYNYCIL